jgi:hypothetical protein
MKATAITVGSRWKYIGDERGWGTIHTVFISSDQKVITWSDPPTKIKTIIINGRRIRIGGFSYYGPFRHFLENFRPHDEQTLSS